MGYSGAGGKLTHEKNQKQKISWHCPLKAYLFLYIVSGKIKKQMRRENKQNAPLPPQKYVIN